MNGYVKQLYKPENDIFGLPQEFKGLKIYPILLKDLKYQELFYKIFARPKNHISNVEILKASYLKFLIYVLTVLHEKEDYIQDITDMLQYLTKKENIEILSRRKDGVGLQSFDLQIKIDDTILSENDFEDLREIVLEQNNMPIDYVEGYNPELEENLAFLNKDSPDLALSDQIFTFCAIMKVPLSEVEKYTLFQFNNLFEKLLTLKEYDLYKPLIASGQITLKSGELKHYLYRSKKGGRYDALFIDPGAFLEKNKDAFG